MTVPTMPPPPDCQRCGALGSPDAAPGGRGMPPSVAPRALLRRAPAAARPPDGEPLRFGRMSPGSGGGLALVRCDSDGSLDPTCGNGDVVTAAFASTGLT